MSEYRPVPDGDVPEFQRILHYAFSPSEEHDPIDSLEELSARATLGDRRGIYAAGELCCTAVQHWFRFRVRGAFEDVPGLSAVATPPEYRRQGLVGRLLGASLAEYRDRGAGFCVLWPFSYPFYRQFGWAQCSRYGRVSCEPEALAGITSTAGAGGEANGVGSTEASGRRDYQFRRCSADDWAALDQVYRVTNGQDLAMDRTEEWWRKRVFTGWENDPYVKGLERAGETVGYLVYEIEEGNGDGGMDDRRLTVREAGHADGAAYRAVLEFCRYHDSQVSEVVFYSSVDTRLQDLACDPDEIGIEIEPGPMIRIADVSRALSGLSYPADVAADLLIDVTDGVVGSNDGRFRLSIGNGSGTCEPISGEATDSGAGDGSADLTASIATLSQVAVGFLSVGRAEAIGAFAAGSTEARETLAAAFPPRETFLREFF